MLYIIVNPASRSGKGAAKWKEFEAVLKENNIVYKPFITGKDGMKSIKKDIIEVISNDDKTPCVCVLGGDGTVNEALNVLSPVFDRIRFVYFPTGSSNDFARALNLHYSFENFVNSYRKGELKEKETDTGLLTVGDKTRRFGVSCGIGYDAQVCKDANDSGAKRLLNKVGLGKLSYFTIAINSLKKLPLTSAYITLDDGEELHYDQFIFAASMIQKYEGGGIKFAPDATADDGMIDIVVAAGLPKWKILAILPLAFFGLHKYSRHVHILRTKAATIKVSNPMTVHTDGEFAGMRSKITVSCEKGGLKYY